MEYSLSKAATVTGKGKSTIHRAIKNGKLSARRHDNGSYSIDAAELYRVFPKESPKETVQRDGMEPVREPVSAELEVLRVRTAMLEEQLGREREAVDDLRRRLDKADERVLALTVNASHQEPKKGLLARLWGH